MNHKNERLNCERYNMMEFQFKHSIRTSQAQFNGRMPISYNNMMEVLYYPPIIKESLGG